MEPATRISQPLRRLMGGRPRIIKRPQTAQAGPILQLTAQNTPLAKVRRIQLTGARDAV